MKQKLFFTPLLISLILLTTTLTACAEANTVGLGPGECQHYPGPSKPFVRIKAGSDATVTPTGGSIRVNESETSLPVEMVGNNFQLEIDAGEEAMVCAH
jgi:hypothetical protein